MALPTELSQRRTSYGQTGSATVVDRFGVWLSVRQIRRQVTDFGGLTVADFGCGFNARLARTLLPQAKNLILVDVALAPDLKRNPKIRAIEGALPEALADLEDSSIDLILCTSVLEHLQKPQETLDRFYRLLRPPAVCLVNVPSWLGKQFLEYSAFRLGMSPREEMDDHKMYYDPRDLWPMLVKAGFKPSRIQCFRHKFGLNTFAVCRRDNTE